MKFFSRLFKKQSTTTTLPKKDETFSARSQRISKSQVNRRGSNQTTESDISMDEDASVQLARKYFSLCNEQDYDGMMAMTTEKTLFKLKEDSTMTADEFHGVVKDIWRSFPDFHFTIEGKVETQRDGSVVVEGIVVRGTHTAAPYGFGPFPPIDPDPQNPVKVENDRESVRIFFQDGKIAKYVFETSGDLAGPPGIYTQLGGFPCI